MGAMTARGGVAAGCLALCGFLVVVAVRVGVDGAGGWATLAGALAGVVGAGAAAWPLLPRRPAAVPGLEVPRGVVGRPAELAAAVAALTGPDAVVGITTGLYGAGGFGKTTLAALACADRRVQRRFRGQVYPVTVGRDLRSPAAIAGRVSEVISLISGEDAAFTDPELAGQRLGSVLDAGPRRLLVLDDVWEPEQLAPFIRGGQRCSRLVTTRVPDLVTGHGTAVRVDQMTPGQAREVLTADLDPLDPAVVKDLLEVTGRWPLLLRLVNKILVSHADLDPAGLAGQASALLARLHADGPAAIDDLAGDQVRGLDINNPHQRAMAVQATIEASTSQLSPGDADRLGELAVFAEDETVPFPLAAALWQATAGLDELACSQLCGRLARLALITANAGHGQDRGITMHDVIRDYLRAQLGAQQLAGLNGLLVDAIAEKWKLPAAAVLDPAQACPTAAWWDLGDEDRYLWDHLIRHLADAGRPQEAEAVACDLRWASGRLLRFGPAAPAADLAAAGTPRAIQLRAVLDRVAHILGPADPPGSVIDILHSRVVDDPAWGPQAAALRDYYPRPRLLARWPLLDLADPALRRTLTGHGAPVTAVAIAPDGSWLASADKDGSVLVWDVGTGRLRAALAGHTSEVTGVVIAPDGSWIATASGDGAEIWDAATGRRRAALTGHLGPVYAAAIAPDGSWIATAGRDKTVRVWDATTGRQRATLTGLHAPANMVVIAPDGSWIAAADVDGAMQVWDAATGQQRAALARHALAVPASGMTAVAVAPDSSWFAAADVHWTMQVWNAATGLQHVTLAGYDASVTTIVVAPDGSWIAANGGGGPVRVWDAASGRQRATLTGHIGSVNAMAVAPDGSWIATAGEDQTVRVWNVATEPQPAALSRDRNSVYAMAVAPDGSWIATTDGSEEVRVWDVATGRQRATFTSHGDWMQKVTISPDGSWLAVVGSNPDAVQVWDVAAGRLRTTLTGTDGSVNAVVIAPDGSWLATGGETGAVRVWDVAAWQQRATLTGHTRDVVDLAIAPDGSWLASAAGDGTVRIWDVATWQQRAILPGHGDWINAVVVAPDGSWLATAGETGAVRTWDAATGQQRITIAGRFGTPSAVLIAPDGSWLATGGADGTARVWDAATGRQRTTLTGHTRYAVPLAVTHDGSWIASADRDGTVRIWDAATGRQQAQTRLNAYISSGTWLREGTLIICGTPHLYVFDWVNSREGPPPGSVSPAPK
jgi:WD40 repeat protein